MTDIIQPMLNSTIQHGKANDRIYLMHLDPHDCPQIIALLEQLAADQSYSKIFVKVPEQCRDHFLAAGYELEATVPQFFHGRTTGHFFGRFRDRRRRQPQQSGIIEQVIAMAKQRAQAPKTVPPLDSDCSLHVLTSDDADAIAELYGTVFASYPFAIHDPQYLRQTMQANYVYYGIRAAGRLLAVSSAEMHAEDGNVEMTDFATASAARGRGLARILLQKMEQDMTARGIALAYTIARALSHAMNFTFADLGYGFAGTLINNTDISGNIESMNIWHKPLACALTRTHIR